jgi:hypothetical protein
MKALFSLVLFIFYIASNVTSIKSTCICPLQCTENTLQAIYPNQNMCVLLHRVPAEIRQLPYVILPTCMQYNVLRFNYNKRFNVFPHAIILPCADHEVARALSLLRKYKLPFSVRSGGHCYEPGSLSSGYIMDLSNFRKIVPNFRDREVTVGAGNHLGPVIEVLGQYGFALPTGTCGSNGFAGLAMGGGLGFLSRTLGATCDAVKSMKVVTADSKIINVDAHNHSDLFWALRGAGNGSYGIVLEYTCKIEFVPTAQVLVLDFEWNPEIVPEIIEAWQSWITTLPDSIYSEIDFTYSRDKISLKIIGFKFSNSPFNEWKKPFKLFSPHVSLKTERYLDAAKRFGGAPTQPFFKAKSKMLFEPLSFEAAEIITQFLNTLKENNAPFKVTLQLGSAGGKLAEGDTSYFPRKAVAWLFQIAYWNHQQQQTRAIDAINTFYSDIEPFTSPFSYANFVDYDLGPDYLNAYYGNHVTRLVKIKKKYDPSNVFRWKQSIPVTL